MSANPAFATRARSLEPKPVSVRPESPIVEIANVVPIDSLTDAWVALVEDGASLVMVTDTLGVVHYANAAFGLDLRKAGGQLVGRSIIDIFGPEFGRERLAFVASVSQNSKPVTIDGFVNGAFRRTTLRPVRGTKGEPLVLHVANSGPLPEGAATPPDVVRSRIDDLGSLRILTPRELDILRLIGDGLSTAEIAETLNRSVKTIEWHRVSIGGKLKCSNRVELARIALFAGLSHLAPQIGVRSGA